MMDYRPRERLVWHRTAAVTACVCLLSLSLLPHAVSLSRRAGEWHRPADSLTLTGMQWDKARLGIKQDKDELVVEYTSRMPIYQPFLSDKIACQAYCRKSTSSVAYWKVTWGHESGCHFAILFCLAVIKLRLTAHYLWSAVMCTLVITEPDHRT